MKAKCYCNIFGNDNFTVGKEYKLIKHGLISYLIETDTKDAYLICNIHHKETKGNHFGFGLCGFYYF